MFLFLFAQARYYLPEIGRFISEDSYKGTLPDTQSQNRYIYCTNNPLKYVDPSGHNALAMGQMVAQEYGPPIMNILSRAGSAIAPYGSQISNTVSRGYHAVGAEIPQIMNMIGNQLDKIPAVFNIGNAATQAAEKGGGSNSGGGSNNFDPNDPRWKDYFGRDKKHFEYTDKVIKQMEKDVYHGFPRYIDEIALKEGKIEKFISSGDKLEKLRIRLEGTLNGQKGVFEYIIEQNGRCNHRFFNTRY